MDRDPRAMKRIAEATGLHVAAGRGWYRQQHDDERIDRSPTHTDSA